MTITIDVSPPKKDSIFLSGGKNQQILDNDPDQVEKPDLSSNNNGDAAKAIVVKRPEVVKPPDHLKAVPIEKDGDLNANFRQEIMWPEKKSPKAVVDDVEKENDRFVEEIFVKIDVNKDRKISKEELENYISDNIVRHLDEAINESKKVFELIDTNKDGYATWEEYHYHFLIDNKIMDEHQARTHQESEHENIDPADQEKMEIELQQWHQADMDPKDQRLSTDEFLAFRHPEHGKYALDSMVKEIFEQFDTINIDGKLSEEEFVAMPNRKADSVDDVEKIKENRRQEFKIIDSNNDGSIDFKELLIYTNPRNPQHAKREANLLLEAADENRDYVVDLQEFKKHRELFLGSSVLDPGFLIHDEF